MSMIGKTLGHYSLSTLLGMGGMGEVYKAKDQKLGRDVAIKVLPEEFAKDADRVARFQREAKLLASLNHPNIAAIHGLEEADGTHFLVLELIEGDTLADRLKHGAIPVEESLKLALQIAEALEAAHEKGIIHRDLKPANIKVTPDGKVKVLDFGLAKALAGEQAEVNLSHSPTLSEAATLQGVILGTAAYMSPEQARGKPVDKRTDIWAFGCVLYEMLTGKAAFQGEDVTEILAAVVKSEVNLDLLPANIHFRIREAITRCLQKDQKKRYGGIGEAQYEIEQVLADPSGVYVQPVTEVEPRTKLRMILLWMAAVVTFSIITGAVVWKLRTPDPRLVTRFSHELPEDLLFYGDSRVLAVSPDGRQFAYCTKEGIHLRTLEKLDAKLLPGTEKARNPFFSPNGKWIGYWSESENQLKKIAISGGAPVPLTDVASRGTFSWRADDTIVYGQVGEGIKQISANGGDPKLLIKEENATIISPEFLPDGKSVLFTSFIPSWKVMVQSLKSGERKELFDGNAARYLPTGHIVYALESKLFAIPFDLEKLALAGEPVAVVEGAMGKEAPQFDISNSGTLVYISGTADIDAPPRILVWVDKDGTEESISISPDALSNPRISPDGNRVAFSVDAGNSLDIWIWDFAREIRSRLNLDETTNAFPLWSFDGQWIVFASRGESLWGIYRKAADDTGDVESLHSLPNLNIIPSSWAGDENTLVLSELSLGFVNRDIGMLSMETTVIRKQLLQDSYNEAQPEISPNGQFIAYTSNESGNNEIYVRPFPDIDKGKWQVSTRSGDSPLWSPDSRELFYRSGNAVMVVPIKTEPSFSREQPKILFQGRYVSYNDLVYDFNPWDISPDGKRFLMMKESKATTSSSEIPRKINIVLNWFEELKEKVPSP